MGPVIVGFCTAPLLPPNGRVTRQASSMLCLNGQQQRAPTRSPRARSHRRIGLTTIALHPPPPLASHLHRVDDDEKPRAGISTVQGKFKAAASSKSPEPLGGPGLSWAFLYAPHPAADGRGGQGGGRVRRAGNGFQQTLPATLAMQLGADNVFRKSDLGFNRGHHFSNSTTCSINRRVRTALASLLKPLRETTRQATRQSLS